MRDHFSIVNGLISLSFLAVSFAFATQDAEAASRRKPAAVKQKSVRMKAAPVFPVETRNEIVKGIPAEVSSIVAVLEGNQIRILKSDEPDARRSPASITKLMTLAVVFDALRAGQLSLSDKVVMVKEGPHLDGTKIGLRAGDALTVEEAILSLVTRSANDVALSIAVHMAGSQEEFADMMNRKARSLQMSDSHFVNPHGLRDEDHYTTANDLLKLGKHLAEEQKEYYHYFSTTSFIFRGKKYSNHNSLMSAYAGMDGMKTGMTNHGFQLMASAVRTILTGEQKIPMPHRLIGVFLGGINSPQRNNCLGWLLDDGFKMIGYEMGDSKFKYSDMSCTSKRNHKTEHSLTAGIAPQ